MRVQWKVIERGHVVAELEGDLNLWSVPEVRDSLLKVARKKSIRRVGVDLRGVRAMDTAGTALLVELHQLLFRRGSDLRLRGVEDHILKMIRLAGLEGAFEMENS